MRRPVPPVHACEACEGAGRLRIDGQIMTLLFEAAQKMPVVSHEDFMLLRRGWKTCKDCNGTGRNKERA